MREERQRESGVREGERKERGVEKDRGERERRDERGAKIAKGGGSSSDREKVGCEKGRGRREEWRRTGEMGNGGMGEGRAARSCWAGGSGGSMCSVCPASACVGAKVEAGSCPAAFEKGSGASTSFTLPAGENGPLVVGH